MCIKNFVNSIILGVDFTVVDVYTHENRTAFLATSSGANAFFFSELIANASAISTFFECKVTKKITYLQVFFKLFFPIDTHTPLSYLHYCDVSH